MAGLIHRITNLSATNILLIEYIDSNGQVRTDSIFANSVPKAYCGRRDSFKFFVQNYDVNNGNPANANQYNDYNVDIQGECDAQPAGGSGGTTGGLRNPGDTTPANEINTKFKLRLTNVNSNGKAADNILNGVRMTSGEVYEFDAKNFKPGIAVQSE
jgi:hypothetical protein